MLFYARVTFRTCCSSSSRKHNNFDGDVAQMGVAIGAIGASVFVRGGWLWRHVIVELGRMCLLRFWNSGLERAVRFRIGGEWGQLVSQKK